MKRRIYHKKRTGEYLYILYNDTHITHTKYISKDDAELLARLDNIKIESIK